MSSWRVGSFREATRTPREQPSAIVVWVIRDVIFTVLRTPHPISIPTTHAFARVSATPRCHTGYGGWIDSNTWSLVRTTSGRVRGVTPGYRSRSASTCSGGCGKGGVWLMSRPVDLHDTHTPGRQCMLQCMLHCLWSLHTYFCHTATQFPRAPVSKSCVLAF